MVNKLEELKRILGECGRVTVAFSSGVDSTFLLKVARDTLGKENVLAATVASVFIPERELKEAKDFCEENDINHLIVSVDVLSNDTVKGNPIDRCYHCKKGIFGEIIRESEKYWNNKGQKAVICEGSNVDDESDYRPGMRAISELSVKSPLREASLKKTDIRSLSKEMNLDTWEKPSFACLASRFVYGEELTEDKLSMVDRAEQLLLDNGFKQFRVRIHGDKPNIIARIELLPEDMPKLFSRYECHDDSKRTAVSDIIETKFKEIGFSYTALDLKGYISGSMNENIEKVVK